MSVPDRARSIALPSQSFVSLYCLSCSSRVVLCLNLLESVLEMSFCVGMAVIADGFSGCAFAALSAPYDDLAARLHHSADDKL